MERREAIEAAVAHVPLMLTVEQTCEVLGIGRTLAYAQVRRYMATAGPEGIPAVRIGSAVRVPRAGLVDLMVAAPGPDASGPATLHVVATGAPRPRRRTNRRHHSASSSGHASEPPAQLPFVHPDRG